MAFASAHLTGWRRGCVLVGTPDQVPDDALRRATNIRLDRVLGAITPRPGWLRQHSTAIVAATAVDLVTRLFSVTATYGYAQLAGVLYRLSATWGTATNIASPGTQVLSTVASPDGNNNQWRYFTNATLAFKDNGTLTRLMGVAPPTAAPTTAALATDLTTTIDQMDAAASWTGTSVGGLADDANIYQETPSAVTFTVAASTFGHIAQRLGADVNLDTLTGGDSLVKDDDYIFLWVRIDRPERVTFLQIDVDIDSASTVVGDAFRRNYYSIRLGSLTRLSQGIDEWTKLQIRKSEFTRYGTDTTRSWVNARTFRIGFLTNSQGAITVHLDDFKLRGGVGIEGDIEYTVCYRNSTTGGRGNPPLDSSGVVQYTSKLTVDRQRVNLTISNVIQGGANHPASDTQIDKIMVWRKGGAFASAVLVDTIDDTAASPYLDDVSDETLALTNILLETDNHTPPTASQTRVIFGPDGAGHYFMLVDGIRLYVSKPYEDDENRVDNWPADAFALIGDGSLTGVAGRATATQTLVWTKADTYEVTGFSAETFLPVILDGSRGCVGEHAHAAGLSSIYFVSQDGIYEQRGRVQRKLTSAIDPFFDGVTIDGQVGWNTDEDATALTRLAFFHSPRGSMLVMLYCEDGSSILNKILVVKPNPDTGDLTECFFDESELTTLKSLFLDDPNGMLLAGGADGFVYQLEVQGLTSDGAALVAPAGGTDIEIRARTKSLDMGQPSRGKYVAHAVIEGLTTGDPLDVTAYYDRNTVSEVLSDMDTTSVVALSQHPTSDPEARYRDVALDISGATDEPVQITRVGVYAEAQPEMTTFLDSGEVAFEFVQQCKRFLVDILAPTNVTVRVYADSALLYTTTLIAPVTRQVRNIAMPAGVRGRTFRITYTASSAFLHYNTVGWFKPLGGVQGYAERVVIGAT